MQNRVCTWKKAATIEKFVLSRLRFTMPDKDKVLIKTPENAPGLPPTH